MTDISLPPPPEDQSLCAHVRAEWSLIVTQWSGGWAADSRVDDLDHLIEFRRAEIFERRNVDPRYDWGRDWVDARMYHQHQIDFVRNRRKYNEDVQAMWLEWARNGQAHFSAVSLEALRSMVLINGAAIIAAISVLTGQLGSAHSTVIAVAKLTVLSSVVSLLMMGGGHALLFDRINDVGSRVRGALVGYTRHRKLYAIGRYIGRYLSPIAKIANWLIYGSIAVFGTSAFVSALLLMGI